MIDSTKLKDVYIEPILKRIKMYSPQAVALLLGTAAVESDMGKYVKQIEGPALGIFQMEPATYRDICNNVLPRYWDHLKDCIIPKTSKFLQYDLQLAIIMCRLHYVRFPEPLPDVRDINGQAELWKLRYNTPLGKGTIDKYIDKFKQYVESIL